MYKLRQGFIILLVFVNYLMTAQTLQFNRYTTKDGLLSDEVYNIYQDRNGYLWLFTNYGAMKYNGKSFEPVLKNLPFNESFIYSFFENDKGQKWVANSNAKIYEVVNDSVFLVKGTEVISEELRRTVSEISQIYVDDSLNITVVTKHFSYKFYKSQNYRAVNLSNQISSDSIFVHVKEYDKALVPVVNYPGYDIFLWIKRLDFINILISNIDGIDRVYKVKSNQVNTPRHFKRFEKDIYLSFSNKMVRITERGGIKDVFFNSQILNFTRDKNKHLWVACYNNGLYELNENDSIINHYFESVTINDVLVDSQNGLWASSPGSGLFHCKDLNEYHFENIEALNSPISFIKQIDNNLFIANKTGDIFIFNQNNFFKVQSCDKSFGEPKDIIKFNDKYLISFAFKMGMFKFANYKKPTFSFINSHYVYGYSMIEIGNDSVLFLQRRGVALFSEKKNIKTIHIDYKTNHFIKRNNELLLATENGVYVLNNDQIEQPKYLTATLKCNITKIRKDGVNNYWFTTKGCGLFRLSEKNELTKYSVVNGLPSNIINDIDFNTDGSILLCTNKGVFYNESFSRDLRGWKHIYEEETHFSLFYKEDVFLGTKNGLVIIKNNKLQMEQLSHFNLTTIYVNNRPTSIRSLNELSYNENNLQFNFDEVSFNKIFLGIKYELIGSKKYTGISHTSEVIFQNLSPGNYTLTAKLNLEGIYTRKISIPFVIIPAFWQTLWFWALNFILLLLLVIYFVWLYFKFRKNKENKKNEVERLITEYKLIALKAQINPHFMSNCLTAIQHLIVNNKVDEASQYLAKFSLLVRQVLNFSSKPLVSLKEELEISELNIELEQLRFESKFIFEIEEDNDMDLSTILLPPLILQPIVENAIWHGLLPLRNFRKGKLLIKIKTIQDFIHLIVEDNGVGRRKNNSTISNLKESKGIQITRQRIYNLNHFYNKTSKADLIYEDLVDELNNAVGTRVIVVLPLITVDDYDEN